jgi:hypothetical protein
MTHELTMTEQFRANKYPPHPYGNKQIWAVVWKRGKYGIWRTIKGTRTRDEAIDVAVNLFVYYLDKHDQVVQVKIIEVDDPNVWGEPNHIGPAPR